MEYIRDTRKLIDDVEVIPIYCDDDAAVDVDANDIDGIDDIDDIDDNDSKNINKIDEIDE